MMRFTVRIGEEVWVYQAPDTVTLVKYLNKTRVDFDHILPFPMPPRKKAKAVKKGKARPKAKH